MDELTRAGIWTLLGAAMGAGVGYLCIEYLGTPPQISMGAIGIGAVVAGLFGP